MSGYDTLLVCRPGLPLDQLERLRQNFKTVHLYPLPVESVPADVLASVDIAFVPMKGFPECITSLGEMPNLKHIQVGCTGLEKLLRNPCILNATAEQLSRVSLANSAGGYCSTMPNFVLNYITGLYNYIPNQIYVQRVQQTWSPEAVMRDVGRSGTYTAKPIMGKTMGFLGYGALGREFARMCSIFPRVRLLAANSDGQRKMEDGYILPGTGDAEGVLYHTLCDVHRLICVLITAKLPEKMYSASDPASLKAFLSECDVLVACLPSTRHTRYLLDAEKLSWMKPDGIFINVGRGDLIKSEEVLKAVDVKNGLRGAALDVTDPEPLPDGHPLWSHPRIMITPHISGDPDGEKEMTTDILLYNLERLRAGAKPCNYADWSRGY
ncbi:hypothetical protein P7C73_g53, partial [Tremellales sp. Uapishka_1]